MRKRNRLFVSFVFSMVASSSLMASSYTWRFIDNVAPGRQIDVIRGAGDIIHLIGAKYYQFDLEGNVILSENKGDDWQGWMHFPPAISVNEEGNVYIVTRHDGGYYDYKEGMDIRLRKRLADGTWTDDYYFGERVKRNYVVGVAALNSESIYMFHTHAGSNVWGDIRIFQDVSSNPTELGRWNGVWRSDTDARTRAGNGMIYIASGLCDSDGRVYYSWADPSQGNVLNQIKQNDKVHQGGMGRKGQPDLFVDGLGNVHFCYGSYQAVYYNRYTLGTQRHYSNDRRILNNLGEWKQSNGLSAVAASDDGQHVLIVGLKTDNSKTAENSEIFWTLSSDGGDTWSAPQSTDQLTSGGEGRLRPRLTAIGDRFYLFFYDRIIGAISLGILSPDIPTATLTMAVYPQAGGTTDPAVGDHTYNEGTVVDITATPAEGYTFTGWTGDVAGATDDTTTVTMDADKEVTANFELMDVTLTMAVSPEEGGTTTPEVGDHTYNYGTIVDIAATASDGYHFVGWTGDVADSTSVNTTVMMDEDKSVKAYFEMTDTGAPYLAYVFPKPEASFVPRNTHIQFKAEDAGKGVDLSTLNALVDDEAILLGGSDQTDGEVTITSHSPEYTVLYTPEEHFEEGVTVNVQVTFDDLAYVPNSCDSIFLFDIGSSFIDTARSTIQLVGTVADTVYNDSLNVTVFLPDSALLDTLWLTIEEVDSLPELPDGWIGMGLNIHFGPDGIVFEDTVIISVPYTEQDLLDAGVTDPEDLIIYYYHSTLGEWSELEIDHVEEAEMLLYMKVIEFCYLTYVRRPTNVNDTVSSFPGTFELSQNYPNPFNPETTMRYVVPEPADVTIRVYNLNGKEVAELHNGRQPAGSYTVTWDALDQPSGTYLIRLQAGSTVMIMKCVLLK